MERDGVDRPPPPSSFIVLSAKSDGQKLHKYKQNDRNVIVIKVLSQSRFITSPLLIKVLTQ